MALGSGGGAGSRPTNSYHPRRSEAHQRPMSCSAVRHDLIQNVGGIGGLGSFPLPRHPTRLRVPRQPLTLVSGRSSPADTSSCQRASLSS
jgi:hypothetical protein